MTGEQRAAAIVRAAGYLGLATADAVGRPWAAQLQYAWFAPPLGFVVESSPASRHARDIAATGRAAATVATLPGSDHGLDGIQVAGPCSVLDGPDLDAAAPGFYAQTVPGGTGLAPAALRGDAPLRLYELRVDELWILDREGWERDQVSARVPLAVPAVEAALAGTQTAVRTCAP